VAEIEEADYVLLPSTFVARSFLAKGIPAGRLLRVPYPVQKIAGASASAPNPNHHDGTFRVLYVGSISVRKGLRYLIEAFGRLRHPQKELWIVGPANSPTGIEGLSLPPEIKFWGPLKGDQLQNAYRSATVFCLPSIEEGQALVLSEALSYGLPVIATENTGIEDLLLNNEGGMVVPIRDSSAIHGCLNRLGEDPVFLAQKRYEAVQTAARLTDPARNTETLAATLIQAHQAHRVHGAVVNTPQLASP
jgi:glycosyltransferase involved in cell wall biosynthesis